MHHFALFGPPASGKGTQAALLAEATGCITLSTGRLLREALAAGSPIGLEAKRFIDEGQLVPDDTVNTLVRETIAALDPATPGILFDGYPRSLPQAEALEQILRDCDGHGVDLVLSLDVSDEEVIRRLAARRECSTCGAVYNLVFKPPRDPGRCDSCGAENSLVQRPDDHPEAITKRLEVYQRQTQPLIQHYRDADVLVTLPGEATISEVQALALEAIHRFHGRQGSP
ncbi:nucleoside monophosphate kinase [Candidatus Sumerlaeota bacterium]|nr:nucleoside monophosphate kinase [Candidatus Sumerlaeota bacterium]